VGPGEGTEEAGVLTGIAQSANALGPSTAPVTLEYFGDLQCPFCKQFTLEALPPIVKRWVGTGNLRIEYHALQTATRDPEVFILQQVAALAAGRQQKEWNFVEAFYREQGEENSGYVTDEFLRAIAGRVPGLNLSRWTTDRGDAELASEIARDAEVAAGAGLTGTPSFLLGRTARRMTTFSPADATSFDAAIESLLES
jgi:protein-disulfide isomerase